MSLRTELDKIIQDFRVGEFSLIGIGQFIIVKLAQSFAEIDNYDDAVCVLEQMQYEAGEVE